MVGVDPLVNEERSLAARVRCLVNDLLNVAQKLLDLPRTFEMDYVLI